jgi:uncharacterized protein with HEPN domain
MPRDNEVILDLHQALQNILTFTQGMSKEEFLADEKTQSSVLYQFIIVGEAVNRLSDDFKAQNSQVPFARIRGMRNRVVHEYSEVDQIVVWEAIQTHIPDLLNSISPLIP